MNFDKVIIQTDKSVIINASNFVKHEGYTQKIESLLYALHCIREDLTTKEVKFVFDDQEPIKLTAFDMIANRIKEQFNIQNLSFSLVDHTPLFNMDGVKVDLRHTYLFKVSSSILADNFSLENDPYTFGAFFGRFSINRMLLAYFIENTVDGLVGFQPGFDFVEFETRGLTDFFDREITWLKDRKDANITLSSAYNGGVDVTNVLPDYKNIWGKYRIEIVSETNTYDCGWFTEKTTKCLASGKPFILSGTQGQMQKLRNMGFKTYSPWIDESYDLEPDVNKRLDLIKKEILRIHNMPTKAEFFSNVDKIAEHNRNIYKEVSDRYYQTPL